MLARKHLHLREAQHKGSTDTAAVTTLCGGFSKNKVSYPTLTQTFLGVTTSRGDNIEPLVS